MVKKIIIYLLLLFPLSLFSQGESPVKWDCSVNKINDTIAELVFEADIDKEWHLYTQDFPEGGPIPLKFHYTKSEEYVLIGKTKEAPKAIEEYDEIFEINVRYIKGIALFTQRIKILKSKPFVINVSVVAQACKEMCVMVDNDFKIEINN